MYRRTNQAHLKNINQPNDEHGSDGDSFGLGELFDAPEGPPPAKQLLAVAIKAREQSGVAEGAAKRDTNKGEHLSSLNQPRARRKRDGDSLGSGELFDAPKGPIPVKPLLMAAIKARKQSDGCSRKGGQERHKQGRASF